MLFSKNEIKTRKSAGFFMVPSRRAEGGRELNSRPWAYELDSPCTLKNASTDGINNSIAGHLTICGGVLE
jgi:hypothetical protein